MGAEIFQKVIYKPISAKQKKSQNNTKQKSLTLRVNSNSTKAF